MFAQIENQADLIKHSVTEGDVANQYKPGSNAVWRVYLPAGYGEQVVGTLPAELPRYWTPIRDRYTRATVLNESLWAASVAIACTKTASLSFEIESEVPQRVKRAQEMMLALNGTGYVPGVSVGVRDFLTTDNGEFWEIVRVSNAAGSKILGLMHLDSIRCTRTGDPNIPLLYRDLKGRYHELKDYQCIMMSDMPSAAAELFGVGYCAASRAYTHIYKMAAIDRYFNEKITGSKANAIEFVSGVTEKTIDSAMKSADEDRNQRGLQSYKGVTIVPVYSDKGAVSGYHVDIAGIPDNFDRKEEFDIAITIYADSIGLDPQDLKPLSGQGLGTGAQSHVQNEKSKGKGLSARRKDFTQKINEDVFPEGVTFYFREVDLTDDQKKAEISSVRATTRQTQVSNGEITNVEARALAVEQDDLPKEYMPDSQLDDTLSDEEKQDETNAVDREEIPETEDPSSISHDLQTTETKIKGDVAGHEFHGNQFSSGGGGGSDSDKRLDSIDSAQERVSSYAPLNESDRVKLGKAWQKLPEGTEVTTNRGPENDRTGKIVKVEYVNTGSRQQVSVINGVKYSSGRVTKNPASDVFETLDPSLSHWKVLNDPTTTKEHIIALYALSKSIDKAKRIK